MAELFDGQQNDQMTVDPNKNYFEELVGEGKKFATPEELARGKAESDTFINRITEENKTLREELKTHNTLQSAIDQLRAEKEAQSIQSQGNQHQTDDDVNQHSQGSQNQDNALTKESVEAIVQEAISNTRSEMISEQNMSRVVNSLTEQFGPNFQTVVTGRAQELGLGENYLTNLAKEQPKAFLALMGVSESPQSVQQQAAPDSARSNPGNSKDVKNFNYYEEIRKKDPDLYNSVAMHHEMMAALEEQGDDFYK